VEKDIRIDSVKQKDVKAFILFRFI